MSHKTTEPAKERQSLAREAIAFLKTHPGVHSVSRPKARALIEAHIHAHSFHISEATRQLRLARIPSERSAEIAARSRIIAALY